MCEVIVCEVIVKLLYVKFVCVKLLYVTFGYVKLLYVKLLYVKFVCVKFVCVKFGYVKLLYVTFGYVEAAGGGRRRRRRRRSPGYRIKNKNPTQRCGEKTWKFNGKIICKCGNGPLPRLITRGYGLALMFFLVLRLVFLLGRSLMQIQRLFFKTAISDWRPTWAQI